MAFTIEEVERALTTAKEEWGMYHRDPVGLKDSLNYPIITGYLTGQISSIQGIQQDNHTFLWGSLINLLKNIDPPSANDQLVLDVIHHPDLLPYMTHYYKHWLLGHTFNNGTEKSFQAVLTQLRQLGLNDDDIFNLFIFSIRYDDEKEVTIDNTPLKEFLVAHIMKSKRLIYPKQGYSQWDNDWSLLYFQLLEETRPEFAADYSLYGMFSERNNPALFFTQYKQGKYLPGILSFISNQQDDKLPTIQLKFGSAIRLFETDSTTHEQLMIKLAIQYLNYFRMFHPREKWESGFHLEEFTGTDLSYLPYSSCAFHFLLEKDKTSALNILKDWLDKKIYIPFETIQVVHHHLGADILPYLQLVLQADNGSIDHYRKLIGMLQKEFKPLQYLPLIWTMTNNKSRSVKEMVARIIAENDTEAETKSIGLLEHKNADTRQTAALILREFSSENAMNAITRILNKESNDNARDILLQVAAVSLRGDVSDHFIQSMVNAAFDRGKLSKPIEPWLDETELPPLYKKDGASLDSKYIRFLLYRMSRVKDMRSDIEAKYILQQIAIDKAAPFALSLIKTYMEKGAKPEHKFVLALSALLGNDAVVDKIRIAVDKWIDENRYKMAEHGVGALALQGSDKALRWVEWYSRKYKSKKANVGAAALVALETAADEQGITIHELGDRIIPDFGFTGLFKHFNVNGEEYRAFIDSNFKIAFFTDDNKKLKSLPGATDAILKEEFKSIAKEVREIVKSQSSRLEYYLVIQRRWNYEQWSKFFLENPVMFIYATKLLWGVYDEKGQLTGQFICNEDTSLVNEDNDEIAVPGATYVGIVHPTQLSTGQLQKWKQQFYDLSIDPIFPQLDRKVSDMDGLDLSKAIILKYMGKQMVPGSIKSTLERNGWHKGPTGDGGMIESFNLLYFEKKMEAVLELEGVGAGYGWGTEEKLGRLYVVDKIKVPQRWFNHPQHDTDDRLVKWKDVPVIFLTEMLAAIESIKPVEK